MLTVAQDSKILVVPELIIDLYGFSLEKAKFCVLHTLAHANNIRKIRIITGRGNHLNRSGKRAILYNALRSWISESSYQSRIEKVLSYDGYYEIHLKANILEQKEEQFASYLFNTLFADTQSIKNKADRGDADAQFTMAVCLTENAKNDAGFKEAFKYYLQSAKNGNADAMISVARCYMIGRGIKQDDSQAVQWLKQAFDKHQFEASRLLGDCYWDGYGIKRDLKKAVYYYQIAAANKDPLGMRKLASAYATGLGIKKNQQACFEWYKKAADCGEVTSQYNVAVMLEDTIDEKATASAKKQVWHYFMRAAEGGDPDAQFMIGYFYMIGKYVAIDAKSSDYWLQLAAENGSTQATEFLRWPKENDEALLKRSAQAGNIFASVRLKLVQRKLVWSADSLAELFLESYQELRDLPLPEIIHLEHTSRFFFIDQLLGDKNLHYNAKALEACTTMASEGCIYSLRRLADAHYHGLGVKKNPSQAIYYLKQAYQLKDGKAAMILADTYLRNLSKQNVSMVMAFGDIYPTDLSKQKEIMVYYEHAAAYGYPPANYFLGMYYFIRKDVQKSIIYLQKAIALENDTATCKKEFSSGFIDSYTAIKPRAAFSLGMEYFGTEGYRMQDGVKYLQLAIALGSKEAMETIEELKLAGFAEIFSEQWFEPEETEDYLIDSASVSALSSSSSSSATVQTMSVPIKNNSALLTASEPKASKAESSKSTSSAAQTMLAPTIKNNPTSLVASEVKVSKAEFSRSVSSSAVAQSIFQPIIKDNLSSSTASEAKGSKSSPKKSACSRFFPAFLSVLRFLQELVFGGAKPVTVSSSITVAAANPRSSEQARSVASVPNIASTATSQSNNQKALHQFATPAPPKNELGHKSENSKSQFGQLTKTRAEAIVEQLLEVFEKTKIAMVQQISVSEAETKLAEQLLAEAKYYGFKCVEVAHDGNCFFHALADQIKRAKNLNSNIHISDSQEKLRAASAEYLINHIGDFKEFDKKKPDDLIDEITQQGTWVNHQVIQATAQALNINVVILQSDGTKPIVIRVDEPLLIAFIGYEVGLHYKSLVRDGSVIKPERDIYSLVRKPVSTNSDTLTNNNVSANSAPVVSASLASFFSGSSSTSVVASSLAAVTTASYAPITTISAMSMSSAAKATTAVAQAQYILDTVKPITVSSETSASSSSESSNKQSVTQLSVEQKKVKNSAQLASKSQNVKLCRFFQSAHCSKGKNCPYVHGYYNKKV